MYSYKKADTLVLSGGSVKGFATLGALEYLEEINILKKIRNFYGTSIGSVISYLIIIGVKPVDIVHHLHVENFQLNMMPKQDKGSLYFVDFDEINGVIEVLTQSKTNRLFSMQELFDTFGKELYCITYNYSLNELVILHRSTHPDLPCLDALRMSCAIPLIFPSVYCNEDIYIDGGLLNNFPINRQMLKELFLLSLLIAFQYLC
jgi:NTE family protein